MDLSIRCDSVHDIILATLALVILLSVGAHQRIQRCEGMSWRICESVRNNWQKNNKNHFLTPWESILEQPWFTQGPENKRESLLLFLYLGEFEAMESTLATVPPSPKTIRFLLDYTPSPPPHPPPSAPLFQLTSIFSFLSVMIVNVSASEHRRNKNF